MNLNDEQLNAVEKIRLFLESSNKIFVLTGAAGTGKSTIISQLFMTNDEPSKKIVISATTNKAVSVLKEMFNKYNNKSNIDFSTIQKLCNVKICINHDGEQYFKFCEQNPTNNVKTINDYNIIIVDEASMINLKLLNYLNRKKKHINGKIIFVGDTNQLPPVNEISSLVFDSNYETVTLQNVMRYNSNILKFSIRVRDSIINKEKISIKNIEDHSLKLYKKNEEWLNEYLINFSYNNIFLAYTNNRCNEINNYIRKNYFNITNLREYVNDELIVFNNYYKKETITFYTSSSAKITMCALTEHVTPIFPLTSLFNLTHSIQAIMNINEKNKSELDETNDMCPICYEDMTDIEHLSETGCNHVFCDNCIKMWLKQHNTCPFCRMVIVEDKLVINNNDIMSVMLNKVIELLNSNRIKCWKLSIQPNTACQNSLTPTDILVVRKEFKKEFELHKEAIKSAIIELKHYIYTTKSTQDNKFLLTRLWEYYYDNYINMFADISYGYCITVHKSQGSTFDNVFIDSQNILKYNREDNINYKCLYTAITRASKKIFILI